MRSTFVLSRRDRPLLHLALLGLTFATTSYTFLASSLEAQRFTVGNLGSALAFSLSLLAILGAHEMGHYLYARWHGVDTSLPYFIPFPFGLVGTLGAVIRMRGRIPHRNALVDIGAAGPIAGVLVALPVLLYGLAHSTLVDAPVAPAHFPGTMSFWVVAPQLVHAALAWWRHQPLPELGDTGQLFYGDGLLMLGLQRLVLGVLPAGKDVLAHPLVVSGWFGLLVTMLNLIPVGQLDGGHVAYALLGARGARRLGHAVALGMLGLFLFASCSWLLWGVLAVGVIGFRHPAVELPAVPVTRGRLWVGALCVVLLVLCFMPVPLGAS